MPYCGECLPIKKQASYGPKGKTATCCAMHGKKHGFIDVVHPRCGHDGCKGSATCGSKGGKKTRCGKHKLPEMINLVSTWCKHVGCDKQAAYGAKGGKQTHCGKHKLPDMINLVSQRCKHAGCNGFANHGAKGGTKTHCGKHKLPDMIYLACQRCNHDGCDKQAVYGIKGDKQTRCHAHKTDKMVDVVHQLCTSCDTMSTNKKDRLCSACRQVQQNGASRKLLRIEHRIIAMLILHGTIIDDERTKLNKSIGAECGGYRPDIYINCGTFILVIEIDENQHRPRYISRIVDGIVTPMAVGSYSTECENKRMMSIVSKEQMPVYFIRINPDKCTIDGKDIKVSFEKRCEALRTLIKSVMEGDKPDAWMTVSYLYYDGALERTVKPDLPAGF